MKRIHRTNFCEQLEKLINYLGTRSRGLESVRGFLARLLEVAALTKLKVTHMFCEQKF